MKFLEKEHLQKQKSVLWLEGWEWGLTTNRWEGNLRGDEEVLEVDCSGGHTTL